MCNLHRRVNYYFYCMTFDGKYFDGKSSAGYHAKVTIRNFSIYITYSDTNTSATIEWVPENIHSNDFAENDKVVLKYGDFPFQYLEVDDKNFAKELKESFPNAKFHKTAFNFIFSTGFIGLAVLAITFVGLLAASYFYILPAAAERIAVTVPIEWEKQLGDAAYGKMVTTENIDKENSERMTEFFKQLHCKCLCVTGRKDCSI